MLLSEYSDLDKYTHPSLESCVNMMDAANFTTVFSPLFLNEM